MAAPKTMAGQIAAAVGSPSGPLEPAVEQGSWRRVSTNRRIHAEAECRRQLADLVAHMVVKTHCVKSSPGLMQWAFATS